MGIIKREDIPKTILGNSNREILSILSQDVIRESYEQDFIAISEEAYDALKVLRRFNFEKIYTDKRLKLESSKIKKSYRILFEHLLQDLKMNEKNSYLWLHFLNNKSEKYLEETSPAQIVIDYISGMTDTYFVRILEKLVVPQPIEWN